jgi:lipopolysaccharide/colanic/teichoic acid biosynthesis glycosyltransferase|tara:strand:- start:413 stop:835 length:423 start_codon:yes stop_codon:yes gene_type:complete
MIEGADKVGPPSTSQDDPRITELGEFLRKTKLDELPQLINVLKGDMSLVGPRPEVSEVVDLMTDEEKDIIFSVKPGITDLASLWNIREEEWLDGEEDPHQAYLEKIWPEKKRLQIEYINKKSLWLDLKIIILTIKKLLVR